MRVTDDMVEAGLSAARDASEARLPRYSVVRAILEAALSHAAGQDGEQCRAASGEVVEALIEEVQGFANAYPEDVFPPLTDGERAENGHVIQRAAAAMGRHMAQRFLPKALALREASSPALVDGLRQGNWHHPDGGRIVGWVIEPDDVERMQADAFCLPREVAEALANLRALSRGVPEGNAVIPWRDEIDRMYVEGWAQSLRRIKDYRAYFIEHGYHPEYVAVRLERLLAAIAAQRKEGE